MAQSKKTAEQGSTSASTPSTKDSLPSREAVADAPPSTEATPYAPEDQTVAEPEAAPVDAPDENKCANCDQQAVVRTNFDYATPVAYCASCLPDHYRYLLGG